MRNRSELKRILSSNSTESGVLNVSKQHFTSLFFVVYVFVVVVVVVVVFGFGFV